MTVSGTAAAINLGTVTVAGNLIDMFAAMLPASDLEMHRGINAPTVRVDGMTIAGD